MSHRSFRATRRLLLMSLRVLLMCTLLEALCVAARGAARLSSEQRARFILQPQYADIWYGKADRIYLHGFWKFKEALNVLKSEDGRADRETPDPGHDEGLTQGYFRPSYDASGWGEIAVPLPWNQMLLPGQRPEKRPFAGIGYYRTEFTVPADRKGKRVVLHFDSVQTSCRVWLNGVEVGGHTNESSYSGPYWAVQRLLWLEDFELDVTPQVKFGKRNILVLRVFDDGSVEGKDIPPPDDGGIVGPCYVDLREPVSLPEILVAPELATGGVKLDVLADNVTGKAQTLDLQADCRPWTSPFYTPPVPGVRTQATLGRVQLPPGQSRHQFVLKLKDPVLWEPQTPFLYHLRVTSGGKLLGQTRFGFREFRVQGTQFVLNGHPIHLIGSSPGGVGTGIYQFNHADYLRHALRLYKDMNINFLRVYEGPETNIYYDVCDELGLISQDDFYHHYRNLTPAEITRGEMIAEVDTNGYLGKDGRFTPRVAATLAKWVTRLHNHPSVCMFTGGNEIGWQTDPAKEQRQAAVLNAFYDFVKAHDRQQRPVTPSSGLTVWCWHTPVRADYYDYHSYNDGEFGWAFAVEGNHESWDHLKRIFGSIKKPVINGECIGYSSDRSRKDIQALWRDGRLDRDAYVTWAQDLLNHPRVEDWWDFSTRTRLVRWKGVRSAVTQDAAVRSRVAMTRDVVRVFRRDMPQLQGFVMLSNNPGQFGFPQERGADLTEAELASAERECLQNIDLRNLREMLMPQFATLDMYDRHQFAGRPLRATLYVLNQRYRSPEPVLTVEIALRGPVGEFVHLQQMEFTNVPEQARLTREIEIPLEEALRTGDYAIEVTLLRGSTVLSRDELPLFVLAKADAARKVAGTASVALYEPATAQGARPGSTRAVLDSLGIGYQSITDFAHLSLYRVLLIGADSLDQPVLGASEAIRAWVEKGGRLLCFEQAYAGELPFAPGYRLASNGNSFFADLIDDHHPVVAGTQAWHWELWNSLEPIHDPEALARSERIYDGYILPMSSGVIVSGGDRGAWNRNPFLGMVVAEVRQGNGRIFFSQAKATERYDTDSVAHRYLGNVLAYVLDSGP